MRNKQCLAVMLSSLTVVACASPQAQQTSQMHQTPHTTQPQASLQHSGMNHDAHMAQVNGRGDQAMGFSHTRTTHHFRLYTDGGAIEVTANDAGDAESREQIRTHLAHVAQMFAAGNFEAPMLTHGRAPDGVPVMRRLKDAISYKYEETERGGRVRITTANAEALTAIQEFLRFQIGDHQTGDTVDVVK